MSEQLQFSPIRRIPCPTYETFYYEFDRQQQPVVITNAAGHWGAMKKWSPEWFKEQHGGVEVHLSCSKNLHTVKSMSIGAYMDLLLRGEEAGLYMSEFPFERIPTLTEDIETCFVNPKHRNRNLKLWIGPAGTSVTLHRDNHIQFDHLNNMFAQICGRKRVVLVSPAQTNRIYPRTKEQGEYWFSQVDWEEPDFDRFPLFKGVILEETVLCPGELLFIPGNYWHSLRSLDISISVSCFWRAHRLADVVVTAIIRKFEDPSLPEEYISLSDVEEFGGISQLCAVLDSDEVPDNVREILWSTILPSAREAIDDWRSKAGQANATLEA